MFSLSTFTAKAVSLWLIWKMFRGLIVHYLKIFFMNKETWLKVVCVSSNGYCIITSSHMYFIQRHL